MLRDLWKADNSVTGDIFVYGMLLPDSHRPATLPDYRLAFDGFATIEPCEGAEVLGGVLQDVRLAYYDGVEGVRTGDPSSLKGLYRRVPVKLADGTYAWVYIMNERGSSFPPSASYLSRIEEGYWKYQYPFIPLYEAVERAGLAPTR